MHIHVIYAQPKRQLNLTVTVPAGATIRDAIEQSGVLSQCPEIDLSQQKVGVFGKITALDTALNDGDRIEIYRPLVADPKTILTRSATAEKTA